ncbi:MAG: hypothetical protein LC808_22210 [Actinobacteria bacterium]|nr:hypothetical protein [Actinomycetota bacterium]
MDGVERVVLALIPHEGTTALAVAKKLVLKESDNPDANPTSTTPCSASASEASTR